MRIWTLLSIGCLVVALSVIPLTVVVEASDKSVDVIDSSNMDVDNEVLKTIEEKLMKINKLRGDIDVNTEKQFKQMMDDITSGEYKGDEYFSQLGEALSWAINYYDKEFPVTISKQIQIINRRIERIIKKSGKGIDKHKLAKRSKDAIKDLERLSSEIDEYKKYWNSEEKKVIPDNTLFLSRTEGIVSKMLADPKLFKALEEKINENKIEYFLTKPTDTMWAKINEGKKPTSFLSALYKKELGKALIKIKNSKTFDVEKDLREARDEYSDKDSISLLYAYVLLINWHDKGSMEKGYNFLKQAYDNLETEKLAFNLVRVGLRLGTLDEGKLYKIMDHVKFKGDLVTVGELNDMLLYSHLKKEEYDKAYNYLTDEEQARALEYMSPTFKFVIYLMNGKYGLIAKEVASYDSGKKRQIEELYDESNREK
jgi:hypothetical protein